MWVGGRRSAVRGWTCPRRHPRLRRRRRPCSAVPAAPSLQRGEAGTTPPIACTGSLMLSRRFLVHGSPCTSEANVDMNERISSIPIGSLMTQRFILQGRRYRLCAHSASLLSCLPPALQGRRCSLPPTLPCLPPGRSRRQTR